MKNQLLLFMIISIFFIPLVSSFVDTFKNCDTSESQGSPNQILYNGDSRDKIDLVIIGEGYSNKNFNELVQEAFFGEEGFFSTEPYKSMKDHFNIWSINTGSWDISDKDALCEWGVTPHYVKYLLKANSELLKNGLSFADRKILLTSSKSMWPTGWQGMVMISPTCYKSSLGKTLTHEMGHAFGLEDEYIVAGGSLKGINCASDQSQAENLWGSFAGQGDQGINKKDNSLTTGYFSDGCTTPSGIRSVYNGIMRSQTQVSLWERGYGEYNINLLTNKIEAIK